MIAKMQHKPVQESDSLVEKRNTLPPHITEKHDVRINGDYSRCMLMQDTK
jgi:hypothetical protein